MSRAPFPFLDQSTLERRLDTGQLDYGLSDGAWSSTIEDIIDEETGWVYGVVTGEGVAPDGYADRTAFLGDYPEVRRAMVRLCRASVHEIEEDSLESESAEDRSESYRSPQAIREEVRAELEDLEPPGESGDPDAGLRADII